MSPVGFGLILAGGLIYTFGVCFFLWESLPFNTTIWHVMVLAASALVYSAIIVEYWGRAASPCLNGAVLARFVSFSRFLPVRNDNRSCAGRTFVLHRRFQTLIQPYRM